MPKIAVYAGHGGSDFGAVANGVYEKNINLAISNAVSDILRQKGYDVLNNRTADVDRNITRDANMANDWKADGLLEIHLNSNAGKPGSGTEMLYSIKDTGKGKQLAQASLDNLVALGFADRGIRTQTDANGQDEFGILRLTNMPAVLAETAFINNPLDLQKLNVYQVAEAYADAVQQVFPLGSAPLPPPPPPPPSPPGGGTPPPAPGGGSSPPSGGTGIRDIQNTLNERYGLGLAADGLAGPLTRAGLVKGLQIELNRQFGRTLAVDGVFGPATGAAAVNVRPGARGNLTYLIQAALYLKGYSVTPDGIFGPKTETAVTAFQRSAGLAPDGIAGPATQTALFTQS
ncbi:MAG: N-acetylmuramoyl-L-alanine amidase [Oscillospiraceae bacterium]|jgi:N-acetylmuramoyl-L-alanine amidase|nr:N-acetylmuramoyl-L-alanine amidase [Oscillospiraceae bacterium]